MDGLTCVARAGIAIAILLPASCTNTEPEDRVLHVFAAASLTDAFGVISEKFEENNQDVDIRLNLLSSSDLAAQIEQGAPADVFASADVANMERLEDQGLLASASQVFATNKMTVVVESGNPEEIDDVTDLSDESLVISLAAPGVPAGDYARAVLKKASVEVSADSEEQDVRAVLTRVATGEADAGIVYESDVATTSDIEKVSIPDSINVVARYPIATLSESDDEQLARSFVSLVRSPDGLEVMVDHGFAGP